jgi:HD-GYP domain-containing protein (c-di-GMP phosphodiesterase class II)
VNKVVQKAEAESTPATDRSTQRLGRGFLFAFHAALRALKLYPLENRAVQNTLAELDQVTKKLAERDGSVGMRYVGDFCFINDLRLRPDLTSYSTFGAVGRALERHEVGALEVNPGATSDEWTVFLSLLLQDPAPDDRFERLYERLGAGSVRNIMIEPVAESGMGSVLSEESREAAKKTYAESVAVAKDVMLGVRMGRGVSVRRVKRAVQQIVDQVLNNESSIMGMTVLRDYDQYTFAHSVNVCIFSLALGKKLGLDKAQLYELGMGALMHDIGKVKMPIELTTKTGQLDEVEWQLIKEHPTEGLLALLEMPGMGELPLRTMLMAYEHHMKMDLTGYPSVARPREPTLFSRIVAIADGFDAGTSKRSYQSVPWLPDAVLREMRDNPTRGLDPLLVKAFISMTGFYPVGCVVILDSFELAVVIAPSTKPECVHQPVVRLIYDEMGMPLTTPRTLDLTEIDPATGEPVHSIIKTTDPEKYGINVKDYFV